MRSVSLERHETDIALRLSKPQDGDVMARYLTTIGFGFFGTENVCAHVEAGNDPAFVGFDEGNVYIPGAVWLQKQFPNARISFRTNNQLTQAVAARSAQVLRFSHIISGTITLTYVSAAAPTNLLSARCGWLPVDRINKSFPYGW